MSAFDTEYSKPQNDSVALPAEWTDFDTTEIARFERDDGALVRVRSETPITSAERFNRGERIDAQGTSVVLFHTEPLPSEPEEIHRGGDANDARAAALAFIREGDR